MKKIFRIGILTLFASAMMFVFSSCESSPMERDAEALATKTVEFEQAQQRFGDRSNLHGKPLSRAEMQSITKEYKEFKKEMTEKYKDSPEFDDLVNEKINSLR